MSDFARQSRRDAPIEAPRIGTLRWVVALLVVMLVGAGLVWVNSRNDAGQAARTAPRIDPNATVDALIGTSSVEGAEDAETVLSEPERRVGQTVKVRAGVEQVLNERAFLIDADGLGAAKELLVLAQREDAQVAAVRPGIEIIVQGKIVRGDLSDLATKADVDLDSAFVEQYGERPVLLIPGNNVSH